MSHIGKAVRLTDTSRELFQFVIPEPIPEEALYLLLTKDGYLFFNEQPELFHNGEIRVPHMAVLSYLNVEIED